MTSICETITSSSSTTALHATSRHDEGAAWLADAIRNREPLLWTGHGASFALAQAFAEALDEMGCASQAIPVHRARGKAACFVSQSGDIRGAIPRLFVTASEDRASWPRVPRMLVPVEHGDRSAWLPMPFLRSAVGIARRALRLPSWPHPVPCSVERGKTVVVVTRQPGPLAALLYAARSKLEQIDIEAVACDELGHGFHTRIWQRPAAHHVVLLRAKCDDLVHFDAVRRFCIDAKVSFEETSLGGAPGSGAGPLEVLDHGLALVEAFCRARNIDWRRRPIPESADWLRSISTEARRSENDTKGGV